MEWLLVVLLALVATIAAHELMDLRKALKLRKLRGANEREKTKALLDRGCSEEAAARVYKFISYNFVKDIPAFPEDDLSAVWSVDQEDVVKFIVENCEQRVELGEVRTVSQLLHFFCDMKP